ncbi:conserved hypothetical protein [Perkinsus marinus ATCC 50983]|uniref:J domain-containing protein n=1 Tax=Perkinsus marinus (strain ATCC 50983 / TXsc) TaxID=423536 RepID=C5M054_PERM5|nr:conserved hypothetical protein [Perkinsus marinus ATCC 50983]EEQ97632.1 conserved hypothetical protein [Perkinsus marinus ATCC 50983]|eukprot:XP_002764915.1 conserved hypothetical protein [Perkinsus marinus ATCC 50983]
MARKPLESVDLSQNHYDVLEVNARTVTAADMKRNFRRLCLKYHPDKGGEQATDHFHRIKMAYDTLSDPRKKVKFDQAYFYARHSAPRNFKRIPPKSSEPSPVEPSSKRPRVVPTAGVATGSSGVNSPSESVSGSVSPPSEDITLDGDLEGMSITKLKCIAKARGIDIATCIEKIDIITALKKGLEAPAATIQEVKNDKAPGATEQPKSPTKTASRVGPTLPENGNKGDPD